MHCMYQHHVCSSNVYIYVVAGPSSRVIHPANINFNGAFISTLNFGTLFEFLPVYLAI